jgi:hypothetical protein
MAAQATRFNVKLSLSSGIAKARFGFPCAARIGTGIALFAAFLGREAGAKLDAIPIIRAPPPNFPQRAAEEGRGEGE